MLEDSGQTYRLAYTSVLNDLGGVYNDTARLSEALAMAQLIGATHEKYGRGGTGARLMALQNESAVLFNMGEFRASYAVSEDVRARRLAIEGDTSEPLSMTVNAASLLVRLGRSQEGIDLARAASVRARSAGNSRWLIFALRTACMGYVDLGQMPEAESALQEMTSALGNGQSAMDPRYRGLSDTQRGLLELRRGDGAAALNSATAALAAIGAPEKGKGREARASLLLAAGATLALNRSAEAERFAQQALSIAEAAARGPDTSADVGEALLLLAKAEIGARPEFGSPARARASRALLDEWLGRRPCLDPRGFCPGDPQQSLSARDRLLRRLRASSLQDRRRPGVQLGLRPSCRTTASTGRGPKHPEAHRDKKSRLEAGSFVHWCARRDSNSRPPGS